MLGIGAISLCGFGMLSVNYLRHAKAPFLDLVSSNIAHSEEGRKDPYSKSRQNLPVDSPADFVLLAGNSNPELAKKVASRLGTQLASGMVKKFADGEIGVSFKAIDVSQKHCYIV